MKILFVILPLLSAGCGEGHHESGHHGHGHAHGHDHGPDGSHITVGVDETPVEAEEGHSTVALGGLQMGALEVSFEQGHGAVEPGKEGHLVVKLSPPDQGQTTVRAWIGIEDRTASYVGKASFSADREAYDVHATAPDPLPEGVAWWVELERPDGETLVGSIAPRFD